MARSWRACRPWLSSLRPLITLLILLSPGTAWSQAAYQPPDCGTRSLYLLLLQSDKYVALADLETALPPRPEAGYSMAELQAAAHRCGLALKGERIDLAGVPLDRAVIAHLNRHRPDSGHFVVLRPIGNEGTVVQVIDPPYAPAVVGYHDLLLNNEGMIRVLKPVSFLEQLAPLLLLLAPAIPIPFVVRAYMRRGVAGQTVT